MLKKVIISLVLFMGIYLQKGYACNVTPGFSNSVTHTCGLPNIVTAINTSTGSQKDKAKYWWKVNYALASDTIIGKDTQTFLLKRVGINYVKLFVKDSAGCIDSSGTTITVFTNAKSILDQNLNYTYTPSWMNCLQFITDPDTFRVNFESADTLVNLRINWGDGSTDYSGNNLSPNTVKTHLYTTLGIFTIKIITLNGNCTDTVYGTVYNQRQPTAGIIGPPSGSNRGCVPHTLRIINNSYNISNNTTFWLDWGNGDTETKPWTAVKDTFFHTYTKGVCAGIIKITATNVCGSSFSTWNPIDISDKDKALWASSSTCNPTGNFVFTNLSSDNYCLIPDIKEYFWDFGDSTTVGWTTSKAAQSHNYKKEGNYVVTLIAKTACGNDTFKNVVSVYYNPVAGMMFDKDRGCNPLPVKVTDTSKGRGLTRQWRVNDGGTIKTFTDSILNYTFTKPGNNSITLTVSNICNTSSITKTFVVTDKPKPSFANINSNCIPVTANFTNTTISYFNNPTFLWKFGDGTSSTQKNPTSKVYNTPGTYTVKLYVSDSCGTDSFSQTFTAYDLPTAIISGDTVACTFDSASFRNNSTNSNTYSWSFGDNTSQTTTDTGIIKHVYTVPGNYTIRLISGTSSGCKDTAIHSIYIKPGAKADFSINQTYACAPATFKITNNSVFGKDYSWFANGKLISTSNVPSDSLVYTDSTVIKIKLIATSVSSCQLDSLEKVYFTPKNPMAIISNKDSGCGPLNVVFNNQSTALFISHWNLGNGSTSTLTNPSVTYPSALSKDTSYNVKLIVRNWSGCIDSTTSIVKIYPIPTSRFKIIDSVGCGPLSTNLTNLSSTNNALAFSTLKHSWDFGDGTNDTSANPNHTFAPNQFKDTIYTISLTATSLNGCKDTSLQSIKVYPLPTLNFTADKYDGCELLNVNFTNHSIPNDTGNINIMSFDWNSGNGNTSNTQNFDAQYKASLYADTIYNVTLIGRTEHGCIDTLSKQITVHPNPVANFTIQTNGYCTPLNLSTINNSVSKDFSGLNHDWDFGNGYKSSFATDSSIYYNNTQSDQPYTITYQAISQYGCRDTAELTFVVHPKPIAKFKPSGTTVCSPAIVTLSDSSSNGYTYYWAEGYNFKGNNKDQVITLPGLKLYDTLYILAHSVESSYGCKSDTVYQQILVQGRPDAGFEFSKDSGCIRETVFLSNTSLGGFKYQWNFGDNTSSTAINPKHQYKSNSGNGADTVFNVTLIATSATTCKDTVMKPLRLVTNSTEGIVLDKQLGCTDLSIQLSNSSKKFNAIFWDFGDNTAPDYGDTVYHTFYNNSGNATFQPKISLHRQYLNCKDTAVTYAYVYPRPIADFRVTRQDPCNDGTHQFINQSKFNTNNTWIVDSSTIFGFNSFSMKLQPSNKYDTFYSARLIVSNNYGCSDTVDQVIKVKPKMLIQFVNTPITACENANVNFTNTSNNAVRYLWNFGDGFISNDVNPIHAFSTFGTYKIMLFGYDKDGCVDSSDGKTFYKVLERPVADFTYLPAYPKLPNALVNFKSKPTISSANVDDLSYEWDFGDGSFPTSNKNQKDPDHTYNIPGTIAVTLKVANNGCENIVTKYIFVEDPKPVVDFTPDTLEGCVPFKVNFKNSTTNVLTYRWIFGDGSPDSYDKEPSHVFILPGKWDVTLVATGTGGTSTLTKQYLITTFPKPVLDFYTTKRFMSLPNAVFNMQNNSNSVFNSWDVFDSTGASIQASKLRDPSFYINTLGRYSVRLIGTNSYGCIDTLYKPDYIGTLGQGYVYVPNAFSPNLNGKNDGFMPSLYNVKDRNYTFKVFNRWGELLFETKDLTGVWDGKYNNVYCEQDVYIWTVNGEYYNGDLFGFRGTVTLLK